MDIDIIYHFIAVFKINFVGVVIQPHTVNHNIFFNHNLNSVGIGKSTLLLQICGSLCAAKTVLYVSGEESEHQVKLRAQRIGVMPDSLYILAETQLSAILESQRPRRGSQPQL